jgi:DnaJ-domain-containing protein 1
MATKTDGKDYYAGQDAYQVLGVAKGSDGKEIKSAYRKLVAQVKLLIKSEFLDKKSKNHKLSTVK